MKTAVLRFMILINLFNTITGAKMERFFMNPHTGSIDTEENWRSDFASMTSEEWGGETFDDAGLIEVDKNGSEITE